MASNQVKPETIDEETTHEPLVTPKPAKKYIKHKVVRKENKKTSNANGTLESSEVAGTNIKDEKPNTGVKKKYGRRHTDDDQNHLQLNPEDEHDAKDKPIHEEVFEDRNVTENDLNVEVKPLTTPVFPGHDIDEALAEEVQADVTKGKNVGTIQVVKVTRKQKTKRKQMKVVVKESKEVKEVDSFDARTAMVIAETVSAATELQTNDCPVCEDDIRPDHTHRDDRHPEKHEGRRASARDEERNRRRSSAKEDDERQRRKSSDRDKRRYSEQSDKRKHSAIDEDKDNRRDEFFRRLSAIVGYDEEYHRNSKDDDKRKSTDSDKIQRRHSDDARRYSDDRNRDRGRRNSSDPGNVNDDRRNSTNTNGDKRESFLKDILDFSRHEDRPRSGSKDKGTHYHQRWMFMWPFGKKGHDEGVAAKNDQPAGTSKALPPSSQQQQQYTEEASCKVVYETEGVQTVDDSLTAPYGTTLKPPMKSDNVQTSFANFGMLATENPANVQNADNINEVTNKETGKKSVLVTHEVQTTLTEIKQSTHAIQTSFTNMKTKKGNTTTVEVEEFYQNNIDKQDDTTSMSSFAAEPKRTGRRMLKPVTSDQAENGNEPEVEEDNEEEEEEEEVASNAEEKLESQKPENSLCPICRKGRYVTQMSLTGCFVAVLCLLCCGPCWCRKLCDITVCNFCGCSKGFYKPPKKAKAKTSGKTDVTE